MKELLATVQAHRRRRVMAAMNDLADALGEARDALAQNFQDPDRLLDVLGVEMDALECALLDWSKAVDDQVEAGVTP